MRPTARLAVAVVTAALHVVAREARADDAPREGGRFGVSLDGGYASIGGATTSSGMGLGGLTLRFGGAFTDRFHLLGELRLAAMPGAAVAGFGEGTAFHAALALTGEGYIGPRFFLRGGVGAGWACAVVNRTWVLPLPGPRFAGGAGYNVWRQGDRALSVAVEVSYATLFNSNVMGSVLTATAGVGFDWY